jgi:hypothetical protein
MTMDLKILEKRIRLLGRILGMLRDAFDHLEDATMSAEWLHLSPWGK